MSVKGVHEYGEAKAASGLKGAKDSDTLDIHVDAALQAAIMANAIQNQGNICTTVTRSFITTGFPKRSIASLRASAGDIPVARLSSMRMAMCECNSASISRSVREREKRFSTRRSGLGSPHA